MPKKQKNSEVLQKIFGDCNDIHLSKKIVEKLVQYNMKYEEITKVILTHSERAFLDARLISAQQHYENLKKFKTSEVEKFLASLPEMPKCKKSVKK